MVDSNIPNKSSAPPLRAPIQALPGEFDWIRMHPSFTNPETSTNSSSSPQISGRQVLANHNHVSLPLVQAPRTAFSQPSRPQHPNTPRTSQASSYPDVLAVPSVNSNSPNAFDRPIHRSILPANARPTPFEEVPRELRANAPAHSLTPQHSYAWQGHFGASSVYSSQPTYRTKVKPTQQTPNYRYHSQSSSSDSLNHANVTSKSSEISLPGKSQKPRRGGKQGRISKRAVSGRPLRPSNSLSLGVDELGPIDPRLVEFEAETARRRSQSRATSESTDTRNEDRIDDLSSDDQDYLEWRADWERKRHDKELFKASQRGNDDIKARGGFRGLRGPRKAAEPTGDIKARLGEAAKAFLAGRYDDSREICAEIIRINAETHEAWMTTASCFLETGQRAKALTAFGVAAHLQPKIIQGWLNLASLYLEEDGKDRASYLSSAQFCYGAALKADAKHVESRLGKAKIYIEWNKPAGAISEYRKVLQIQPWNLQVIRDLCAAYYDNGELEEAAKLYHETFAQFMENRRYFKDEALDWSDLNSYVAIYQQLDQHDIAIIELKSISRWMVDRGLESFWDDVNDDREWDATSSRRIDIPAFTENGSFPSIYGDGLPLELRTKLGISRAALGHNEEAMRHFKWLQGSDESGEDKVINYYYLYRQAGDTLKASKLYRAALEFYEPLKEIAEENTGDLHLQMGYCFKAEELQVKAEECFQKAIQLDEDNIEARMELAKMYESLNEQEQAFIYVNEVMAIQNAKNAKPLQQRKRAPRNLKQMILEPPSDQVDEVVPSKEAVQVTGAVREEDVVQTEESGEISVQGSYDEDFETPKNPKHKPRRLADPAAKLADESNRAAQLQLQYRVLRSTHEGMLAGSRQAAREWMTAARELIDDFRSVRSFYPYDKYIRFVGYRPVESAAVPLDDEATLMAERLSNHLGADIADKTRVPQIEVPEDYRGIAFDEWLNIFLDFALCLARHGRMKESYEVCDAAKDCALWYHHRESLYLIHICWLTCALFLCDEEACCNAARFFMKDYQFTTDSYRMFNAVTRMVNSPVTWYSSGPSQKFVLRQVKAMDYALTTDPEAREKYFGEKGSYSSVDEKGQLIINDELDIGLLMLYGHILYSSNSFMLALNYFLRALALDPQSAMINLNVGLCYVHYALRRQADNRQYLILQGMAFMFTYYNARKTSEHLDERQEAHYNIGRVYHLLGLTNLAIPYYNLVFTEVERTPSRGTEGSREDLVTDAAYNLQSIYANAGNMELAMRITEKWLVI